jgi:uncharacterized protein YkwD
LPIARGLCLNSGTQACKACARKPEKTGKMLRSFALLAFLSLGLAACSTPEPRFGPDGRPLPQVYQISARDTAKIQFRMLDSINTLRSARGAVPLELSAELNAAAATHSRDMSVQNRPWHFGSDGSSPLDRVRRVGYTGRLLGENISETYESELETLSAWMAQPDTREVILDRRGRDLGFAWFQEPNGKIWWTLIVGQPSAQTSLIN